MTIVEYIKRKNQIIFDETGLVLVPEDQIVEVELFNQLSIDSDATACPYCQIYMKVCCYGCPMAIAGNRCGDRFNDSSMYPKVIKKIGDCSLVSSFAPQLLNLINEFNQSYTFMEVWDDVYTKLSPFTKNRLLKAKQGTPRSFVIPLNVDNIISPGEFVASGYIVGDIMYHKSYYYGDEVDCEIDLIDHAPFEVGTVFNIIDDYYEITDVKVLSNKENLFYYYSFSKTHIKKEELIR